MTVQIEKIDFDQLSGLSLYPEKYIEGGAGKVIEI